MKTDISIASRSKEENWLPILELAVEEVFAIMLNCKVKPVPKSEHETNAEFTAMVGLAGSLCGVLTVCCDAKTAHQVAKSMLGDTATSEEEVADALGEICNMIAGNFESGAAQMKSSSQTAFDSIASTLRQRDYPLRIEGYTDNIPIHTSQFPSNWELSTSRATEIVRLLIIRDGFSPDRLSAAGFAEYHPVASNVTAEGRGMNRRVDIVVLSHAPGEASPAQGETQNPAQNLTMSPAEKKTAAPAAPPAPPAPKPSAGIPAVDRRPLQP
jgi:outer membrane protein OmpA-like peptidoglycan-associated protein